LLARAAGLHDLEGDAVAGLDAPSLSRLGPDRLHDADRLVTGDEGEPGRKRARIELMVGAAEPAGLDAQQPVVVAHVGHREAALDERTGLLEHERPRRPLT